MNGYSTLTIGYIGIYESSILVKGCSHTQTKGKEFAMKIMKVLNQKKKNGQKKPKFNLLFMVHPQNL